MHHSRISLSKREPCVKVCAFFLFQLSEQLTPYPQPRFYDPVSSRTFDRSHDKRSRGNSKRFHFSKASPEPSADLHQQQYLNHPKTKIFGFLALPWINPIPPGKDTFYHRDNISCDKVRGNRVKTIWFCLRHVLLSLDHCDGCLTNQNVKQPSRSQRQNQICSTLHTQQL